MKRLFVLLALALTVGACTSDSSTGEDECSPDAACAPTVSVPDVVGLDIFKAVNELEEAGLAVDVSALPKRERAYSRRENHPRMRVVEMDPPPGTRVEEGTSIAILETECVPGRSCSLIPTFRCPRLLPPGEESRSEMRPAVTAYLDARQPEGTDGYHYRIKRLHGRSELGSPEGRCAPKIWRRSFRVEGSFEYEQGATNRSASLAYFRVIVGRTGNGWIVWAEPH